MLSGNGTISERDKIVWSAGCFNGEASYPISSMLFFHSRPMAHAFHRPKIPDGGTLRSSILKVRITVFEIQDPFFNLFGDIARGLHPFTHMPSTPFASVTLIHHGYIGASPDQPHLAFSIQLLTFYRQLRRVHPRFSFGAFAKCLNHFHSVSELVPLSLWNRSQELFRSHTALIWLTSLATPMIATWRSYKNLIEGYPSNLDARIASGL